MSEKFSDMVQLMAQTSRGDLASFERLYSATSPRLYAMISFSVIGMMSCIFKGTAGLAVLEEGGTYFQVI